MSLPGTVRNALLLSFALLPCLASAQTLPWPAFDEPQQLAIPSPPSQAEVKLATAEPPSPQAGIAAGTHVMMVLRSPLSSTSATQGSAIYLETLYPVIQDNQVVIPAHTQVQGVVKASRRPGHFKRVSEFRFHFTAMIFPNNYVLPIDGVLQGIPGSRLLRVDDKSEGALRTVDQTDKALVPTATGAVAGAIIGADTHIGIGKFIGAGLGAGLGLGSMLLVRGDDINLHAGVNVEMLLRVAASLPPEQAAFNATYVPRRQATTQFVDPDPKPQTAARRQQQRPRTAGVPLFPRVF
jgi:hypothetical protein